MTTCMSDLICVTNRKLCGDFWERVREVAAAHPHSIVLREKDLPEKDYALLAAQVMEICKRYGTPCTLHSFPETALRLGAERIHLPLPMLRTLPEKQKQQFLVIGASVHSAEEAREAQMLGADYLTAGHIFATDCKKGLPGRGLRFLKEVCSAVSVPVYAIGGITPERMPDIRRNGAAGACVMSGLMQCSDVRAYLDAFEVKS